MSVVHFLRGYDRATDALSVQYEIPQPLLAWALRSIRLEENDPEAYGVYPLAASQARDVAALIGREPQVAKDLPSLEFFLEAEGDHETVREQIRQLNPRLEAS